MQKKRFAVPLAVAAAASFCLGISSLTAPVAQAAFDLGQCPWMDTTKTPTERAQLLIDSSTLGQVMRWLDEQSAGTPSQTDWAGGMMGAGPATYEPALPCTPTVIYTDGPDVVRHAGATLYPAPISLASSWDTQLSYDKGAAFGQESYEMGFNGIWAPGVSSARTPLAGRTPEYLGEDSLLSGTMAGSELQGMNTNPIVTGVKHYVANEQEYDRQTSSSNVSDRALHEVYSLPFEIAINDGDPQAVMCSYNQVNGTYACENPILNEILKDDIGFNGFVVSDFGAVHSTVASLVNGLDMELNAPNYFSPQNLQPALDAGQITQQQIEDAAMRVLTGYFAAGVFDTPLPDNPTTDVSTVAHKQIAKTMAEEGSVLLKNAGSVLPLTATSNLKVAIIGGVAGTQTDWTNLGYQLQQIQVSSPFGPPQTKMALPFSTAVDACSESGTDCSAMVSPLASITQAVTAAGGTVTYAAGDDIAAATAVAQAADVAIVFGYLPMSEGNDAASLSLVENGDDLISAVASAAPKTVAVLETGSATDMPWLSKVDSVVEAWYPGEQAGPALSDLLFGAANFTGKLPLTFPTSIAQSPVSTTAQYPGLIDGTSDVCVNGGFFGGSGPTCQVSYSEDLAVGYKWYDQENVAPLFEFGYGLSYTTFAYSNLATHTAQNLGKGTASITVDFDVTNTGAVAGSEIPQVYLTLPASSDTPGKRLVAFDRIDLAPGQTTHVTEVIDSTTADHPMSVWDEASGQWVLVPGNYGVSVGASSRIIPLSATVAVPMAPANTTALQAAVASATAMDPAQFTSASWADVAASLQVAQAVLANGDVMQADVDQALSALQAAVARLVAAPIPQPDVISPEGITTGGSVSHGGAWSGAWVIVGSWVVAMGAGGWVLQRRRRTRG
ncbi:MAG: glycoside hydrolase family 3 C-terminal domain-containing protein [Propionibacteriaceae bacterium]|nr:glycoside hydrolase family 3 C-terminal domain-containing protein [Propionibacteriaceae bacterium]